MNAIEKTKSWLGGVSPSAALLALLFLAAFLLSTGLAYALRLSFPESYLHVQFCGSLAFLGGMLAAVFFTRHVVRKFLLGLAISFACVLSLSWAALFPKSGSAHDVYIARFPHDVLDADSQKLAHVITRFSTFLGVAPTMRALPQYFVQEEQVREFLHSHPNTRALVWGDKRWLRVSFPIHEKQRTQKVKTMYGQYRSIRQVPEFGISYEPIEETARFLAELFSVGRASNRALDSDELKLHASALQRAFWSSTVHSAYAYFQLGNVLLEQYLSTKNTPGELLCASTAFRKGLSQTRYNDDSELRAALVNNYALTMILLAEESFLTEQNQTAQKNHHAQEALRHLHGAIRLSKGRPQSIVPPIAGQVATINAKKLTRAIRQKQNKKGTLADALKPLQHEHDRQGPHY